MHTFARPDFEPMFPDNITWYNDSIRDAAIDQCGDDHQCLFDVASTNDVSVGLVTKDISIQLVNESNILGELFNISNTWRSVSSEYSNTEKWVVKQGTAEFLFN